LLFLYEVESCLLLFLVSPKVSIQGCLSRDQFEVVLEKRELLGEKKAGKQYMKMNLPIMGILSVLIIGLILLAPMLE